MQNAKPILSEEQIRRALQVGKQLSEATDELNRQISRLQQTFTDLFRGRKARVSLRHFLEPKDGYIEDLIFDSNRFWVEMGYAGKLQLIPLLNSPREVRMDAVSHFEELLKACQEAV